MLEKTTAAAEFTNRTTNNRSMLSYTPCAFPIADEPTSGLDAASASEIMALLKRLASDSRMLIVTSVHQPSTRVFNSFDQVRTRAFSIGFRVFLGYTCVF